MDSFVTYLFSGYFLAIFMLALRNKVNHKMIRPFKIVLWIIFGFAIYSWAVDSLASDKFLLYGTLLLVYLYMLIMMYLNEIEFLLKRLGLSKKKKSNTIKINNELAQKLSQSVEFLANRKIGALITIEREVKLSTYIAKAMPVNAPVTSELLASIFIPTTPLHDGAVIIRDNHILCAKAYYPSTERTDLPLRFGTRHRAAIGISEQSDALTIVVSEETGKVSVTINRQIDYDVSRETMQLYFEKYLKLK